MLNIFRLTFLILSLGAVGFALTYNAHPEWVNKVDRWLCDRHLQGTQEVWDRVQASTGAGGAEVAGLHQAVLQELIRLGDVQYGERRFELWRRLVIWYVAEAREWGELDRALDWQERLMDTRARDVQQGLVWVELLGAKGRPKDLEQAGELLKVMRLGLPDWEPALLADMRLALLQRDWERLVAGARQWQNMGAADLVEGWQWFHSIAGQAKLQAGPKQKALRAQQGFQYNLAFPLQGEQRLKSLRVDPPARALGSLESVRFVGLGPDGETIELVPLKARDCTWDAAGKRLALSGEPDPRITLRVPAQPITQVQIVFAPKKTVPQWILEAAGRYPGLQALLKRDGSDGDQRGSQQ